MRRVRELKKSQNLIRSVQSQSREIISSIYSSTLDHDQLEFSQSEELWNISPQNLKTTFQQPTTNTQQPLKHLLPLLMHLSHGVSPDICSFILFDYNTIHAVTQEHLVKVCKNKKQKGKLRYWLSHIYFDRLRKQLAEQLIHSDQSSHQHRQIIHANEEKEYMPLVFSAKKGAAAFVRKIKVSSEAMYSKQGHLERQPFCIGYFLNGAEQLFSFTEVLSFIEYPFNLAQISYFKIVPFQKDGTPNFKSSLSKATLNQEQKQLMSKFKRICKRQQRWKYVKEQTEELKSSMISNREYEDYAKLLTLQMMSNLEINEFIDIAQLSVEWIIDEQGSSRLANCFKYQFTSINTNTTSEGLVSLYQKRLMQRTRFDQQDTQKLFRVKKMKSEEKSFFDQSSKVPLLDLKKTRNRSEIMSETLSSFRRKTKSCIVRKKLSKKGVL